MIETPLTRLLNIRHPILLAPMAGSAGGRLAAAVSAAGGLGIIGGGYGERNWLNAQLDLAEGSLVGVGFITWSLRNRPELLDLALEREPAAIMLSFDEFTPFVERIHGAGCKLIAQVQTLAQAREAAALGADVVVAQGTEAGGHGANRATLPLVPAVVDAVAPTPVVAAGGIADGRGLAAALMLGAAGVLMGSRFYASAESLAPEAAKRAAVEGEGDTTLRSSVFDRLRSLDWPPPYTLRALRNEMTGLWHGRTEALAAALLTEQGRFQAAVERSDTRIMPVIVGEAADLISDIPPAAEIVNRVAEEAVRGLTRPDGFRITRQEAEKSQ